MAILESDQRKLCMRSGGRCAFKECRRVLTVSSPDDRLAVVGEMAHIVAERPGGPRGDADLPLNERNRYENLILLCNVHHQQVDSQPERFTVERLRAMKDAHENWVETRLTIFDLEEPLPPAEYVEDTLHSSLLPVEHLPPHVFGAPTDSENERALARSLLPLRKGEMAPFIIREKRLWTFQDLGSSEGPFRDSVDRDNVERVQSQFWWPDQDKCRWFVDLLNRSLNKLTGRLGLMLDRVHHRFYFPQEKEGQDREVSYRPLNQKQATRKVVWQPRRRKTGEPRDHWLHRAVSLRFILLTKDSWALAIRPGMRVTVDGQHPPRSDKIGRTVARKFARMFNHLVLTELQFWRDFLSGGAPRILLPFGANEQYVQISSTTMSGEVRWPGMPAQHAIPFENIEFEEDLFSLAKLSAATDDCEHEWDDDDER